MAILPVILWLSHPETSKELVNRELKQRYFKMILLEFAAFVFGISKLIVNIKLQMKVFTVICMDI